MTTAPYSTTTALDDQRVLSATLGRLAAVLSSIERLRGDESSWTGPAHRLYLLQLDRVLLAVTTASGSTRAALDASRISAHE